MGAVTDHGRPAAAVAASFKATWWSAQSTLDNAIDTLGGIYSLHVTQTGVDEHLYRKARWYRGPTTGAWSRGEPWITTVVNVRSGQVLGAVDSRDGAAVQGWRELVSVVTVGPSSASSTRP